MTSPAQVSGKTRQVKLGWLLNLLIAAMLFFSLLGWLRLYGAISQWQWLLSLPLSVSPLYLAAGGAAWGLAGAAAGLGLWLRQRWAPVAARLASLFFAASYWLDRLTFGATGSSQVNLPFTLILTMLGLAFTWGIFAFPHTRLIYNGTPSDLQSETASQRSIL
jgi:hypothetical protein